MTNFTFLLSTLLTLFAAYLRAGETLETNFWESFAPGELLWLLERATTKLPVTNNDAAERRSDGITTVREGPTAPEDSVAATTNSVRKHQVNTPSSDEINYDEAYEAFVRKYFNDKLQEDGTYTQDGNDDSGSDEQEFDTLLEQRQRQQFDAGTESYNSSGETEPLTEETKTRKKHKSKENCRRVKKNKQNCMICENARSGEKSESCTFSRHSEPQSYAFEQEKNYKKQRDVEEPTSQSVEQSSSEESDAAETAKSFEVFNRRHTSPKETSTCIQMVRSGKVCYQCVDGEGTTTKCYTPKKTARSGNLHTNARPAKAKDHKVQKTQQRIYKRTISYSFEKGTNGTAANETPLDVGEVVDTTTAEVTKCDLPHLKEKIIYKLVKQNETIAE
ncbi:uncharacterized protein [Eurosta solidaginis]|uniref:uncharacterized protein isoform X2 n=1 Tax=Eurosta solidaginis TaxID=178769 RepID=UPI003530F860